MRLSASRCNFVLKLLKLRKLVIRRLKKLYADSLRQLNLSDSIYQTAINIERGLEEKLKNTFDQNTDSISKIINP